MVCPSVCFEQTRISILSWNPGPLRGKPGAIEEHIAGKWHVIALQEAVGVPSTRVPLEPLLHYPLRRLLRFI